MKVTIRSEWPEVARGCAFSMNLGDYISEIDGSLLVLDFYDDFVYRDIAAWVASALACGLILKGDIER